MSDQQSEPPLIRSASTTHRAVRAAFVSFAEHEYPRLKMFLLRCGATHEDSEDATQEAFIDAWRLLLNHPSRWVGLRDPRAWIRRVALRALARPRGQKRRRILAIPLDLEQAGHDPADPDWAEQVALESDVRVALQRLPGDQRLAMAYRLDDFKHATIAEELGVTEQQARDLVKQARQALKTALRAHIDSEEESNGHARSRRRKADD